MWILKKKYDYWWKKYGLEKTSWFTCLQGLLNYLAFQSFVLSRAHQTRRSGRLLRLGFNEVAQFLSKSEASVALLVFSTSSCVISTHLSSLWVIWSTNVVSLRTNTINIHFSVVFWYNHTSKYGWLSLEINFMSHAGSWIYNYLQPTCCESLTNFIT
jgi:hypothetical protein